MIDCTKFANAVAEACSVNAFEVDHIRRKILSILSRLTLPERPVLVTFPSKRMYELQGEIKMYDQFKEAFEGEKSMADGVAEFLDKQIIESMKEPKPQTKGQTMHELTEKICSYYNQVVKDKPALDKLIRDWLEKKAKELDNYVGDSYVLKVLGLTPCVNKTPESIHKDSMCKESDHIVDTNKTKRCKTCGDLISEETPDCSPQNPIGITANKNVDTTKTIEALAERLRQALEDSRCKIGVSYDEEVAKILVETFQVKG